MKTWVVFKTQEAERDAPKKWNPVVEIQYRGGIYNGHCQGGLPEGKVQFYFPMLLDKASFQMDICFVLYVKQLHE